MRTAFIGGGVMGEAILSRALAQGVLAPADVTVAEPVAARREHLTRQFKVAATASNREAAAGAGLIVLAVKPQHIGAVCADLAGTLAPTQSVLSIAAGVSIKRLADGLSHAANIRAMPNTPAQVGAGITVWTATKEVPEAGRAAAAALLGAIGRQVEVHDESYLDMATAVSGSGPAYVFAFMEAMTEAAVHMGLPRDMAAVLVLETVLGSARLAKETGQHPALLREMVTSPGGTTAEALRELERAGFRAAILEAINAAYRKAQALGAKP